MDTTLDEILSSVERHASDSAAVTGTVTVSRAKAAIADIEL